MRYRPPRNKWGADFAEDYERNLEDIERDITGVEEIVEGSKTNAEQALTFATEAKGKAESVQAQFNQVVIEGDSSVEAAQARVDAKNVAQPTLKARLDKDYNEVTAQLAEKAKQTDVTSLSNKRKRRTRKEGSYKITKFAFPSNFGWANAPINIFTDGINYFTDFEVSAFKNISVNTYWVDPINGSNANTGTSSSPFLTIEKAYTVAAAGDTIMLKDGIYFRDRSWLGTTAIKKSINIIAQNKGGVTIPFCDRHTYTLNSGNVYQVARSNVRDVVDFTFHEWGYRYTKVNSIAECQALSGSWYTDGTTLYVHSLTGGIPDSTKVYPILTGVHFKAVNDTADVIVYMEGIKIIGGDYGIWFDRLNTSNQMSLYGKAIEVIYTTGNDGNADSFNIDGVDYAFFQDSVAVFSNKDGFNYTSYASDGLFKNAPKFIEVNCIGANNGLKNSIVGSEHTNNGSTAHGGAKGIRLNCTYFGNMGGNLVDVQNGTQSLNFSLTVYDPQTKTSDMYNTNICTQQEGAEMWVYGAVTFGAAFDIYAVTGSSIYIYDSEFESKNGGGTMEIVNPI
ncbi:DUF1565 domain-containing protein [Priestia flexa]|uniref:DUF1565 domain-containing protein n=1 Tax=Priestia flexa TaxID=86664 RepID=UPI0024913A09|nr:DUF1565 domain-containing protein [Priestia flexa]